MEEPEDQFYNDVYVAKFFKLRFPDLCYDLIVAIFKLLDTSTIIFLQSLINDKYIKGIRIQHNGKRRIYIPYYKDQNYRHDESKIEEKLDSEQSCNIMKELIKHNRHNVYPINLSFRETTLFPVRFIDQMLGKTKNFDISLTFDSLDYAQYHKLKYFRRSSEVTEISIAKISKPKKKNLFDLDLSKYTNLKKFYLEKKEHIRSINLSSSFETLVELDIPDIYDEGYLLNFVNLKSLGTRFSGTFNIRNLPRNIISLCLMSTEESERLIIPSDYVWPQKIRKLALQFLDDFIVEGFKDSRLSPSLKKLRIVSILPIESLLPKLPSSLKDLEINDLCQEPVDFNELSSPGLEAMTLFNIELKDTELNFVEFPKMMKHFYYSTNLLSIPLDKIRFENAKDNLESLTIMIEHYAHESSRLDFSEFLNLSSITLDGCNTKLANIKLPQCLKKLKISNDNLQSVDEQCPFLSDSLIYPNLEKLAFSNCRIDYISSTIKFPVNLISLSIPYYRNKDVLLNIFKHESLTKLKIDSISKPDIFDDFVHIKRVNRNKTSIKHLTLTSIYKIIKKSALEKLYKSVRLAMGKNYVEVEANWDRKFVFEFD
ncbi:hypothetical protein DFJ63DRAFT_311111 [Scheffersomyces coipomensis]|uniref:uncharacterized protein n=1 Tax=Scheffersomyces coipomensis TaxID=1788519 RepID=UPI00315CAD77